METPREFRAAWAGVLFALFIAVFTKDAPETYEAWILGLLGMGMPFALYRLMVAEKPEYKAASGFALQFVGAGTIGAVFLIILPRSRMAAATFLVSSLFCFIQLRTGRRKKRES